MPQPTADQKSQAAWLAAIGEPTRLAIVRALAAGEMSVGAIAAAVGVEVVNASHHLGLMRTAKVVSSEKAGRFVRYDLIAATVSVGAVELAHPSGLRVVVPLGGEPPRELKGKK